jgi:integrase/recombinase XerD
VQIERPSGRSSLPMNLIQAHENFLNHRRVKNVADETLRLYDRVLTSWRSWRAGRERSDLLEEVAVSDFTGFLGALSEAKKKPNTVDSYRRILRAFWRYLEGEGLLSEAQRHFWANDRIPRPLGLQPDPRPYCDDDLFEQLLLAAGDGADEQSARDRAILLLLWESGMRCGEICDLVDEQLDMRQRRAWIVGKGRKKAWVFWGPQAGAAILRYLQLRRGGRGGQLPLFRGVSSRNNGGPMTTNAVRLMIKRLGVELPKGAPVHFLRHGYAHKNIDAGLDASQVQQLMRHSSIETTLRYLKERPDELQELHRQGLGLPAAGKRRKRKASE